MKHVGRIIEKRRYSDTSRFTMASSQSLLCDLGDAVASSANSTSNGWGEIGRFPTACAVHDVAVTWCLLQTIGLGWLTAIKSLFQSCGGLVMVVLRSTAKFEGKIIEGKGIRNMLIRSKSRIPKHDSRSKASSRENTRKE